MQSENANIWVNADDFGFSKSCSDAIVECFKQGLITTTTACSNGEYFDYAIDLIKKTDFRDSIGIHINLTEGRPLTNGIASNEKFCKDGYFIGYPDRYSRLTKKDKNDVYNEIKAQFNRFNDTGIPINHIDSHHHIHNSFRVLPIVLKVAKEFNIKKVRLLRNTGSLSLTKKLYKVFINKRLKRFSYSAYMGSIDDYNNTKRNSKIFEIMVHPDFDITGNLIDRNNEDYSKPTGNLLIFPFKKSKIIIVK